MTSAFFFYPRKFSENRGLIGSYRNNLMYFPVKMLIDSVKRAEKDYFDLIPD